MNENSREFMWKSYDDPKRGSGDRPVAATDVSDFSYSLRTDRFHIKGFIPTSLLDWPGKISSVVFLGGCGFRCPACHNARLVLEPESIPDYPVEQILSHLKKRNTWIDGDSVSRQVVYKPGPCRRELCALVVVLRWY